MVKYVPSKQAVVVVGVDVFCHNALPLVLYTMAASPSTNNAKSCHLSSSRERGTMIPPRVILEAMGYIGRCHCPTDLTQPGVAIQQTCFAS